MPTKKCKVCKTSCNRGNSNAGFLRGSGGFTRATCNNCLSQLATEKRIANNSGYAKVDAERGGQSAAPSQIRTPQSDPQPSGAPIQSKAEELTSLYELFETGAIDDSEYKFLKSEIISRP